MKLNKVTTIKCELKIFFKTLHTIPNIKKAAAPTSISPTRVITPSAVTYSTAPNNPQPRRQESAAPKTNRNPANPLSRPHQTLHLSITRKRPRKNSARSEEEEEAAVVVVVVVNYASVAISGLATTCEPLKTRRRRRRRMRWSSTGLRRG